MKNNIIMKDGIPTVQVVDPSELADFLLIDVRRPDEFNAELGHILGSKLVTLGEGLNEFLQKERKDRKILFICRSSARSGRATLEAMEAGFKQVFNMEGGMLYWNEKRFPITRD